MSFDKAIQLEHKIAWLCSDLNRAGFAFNRDAAVVLLDDLTRRVASIDEHLQIPPRIRQTQLKTKIKYEEIPFNPNSPKQIVALLNDHGWKPTEKTLKGTSWKISERNLATLPEEAPEGVRRLIERMILQTRINKLNEWLSFYNNETGRIHGTFIGIGTWTHRMSHRYPNMGNIAAEKSIKYRSPELANLAEGLGRQFRSLWICGGRNQSLVGTDADGIQLRIFAHYVNDKRFTEALVNGRKDLGTDAHSLNAKILGCSRDTAKTFIYAFLLGAGTGKLSQVLNLSMEETRKAQQNFIRSYPGLEKLKRETIPKDAERGYFQGFDGRYVVIPGRNQNHREHLCMAGYLQNGEALVMKYANLMWRQQLYDQEVPFRQVNFVHDEWQTELTGNQELCRLVGECQSRSITRVGQEFALKCPLAGNFKIGKNWLETH